MDIKSGFACHQSGDEGKLTMPDFLFRGHQKLNTTLLALIREVNLLFSVWHILFPLFELCLFMNIDLIILREPRNLCPLTKYRALEL